MAEEMEMTLNIIVAHGENNEIGLDNQLLWKLPTDMKRFKEITTGHTVVMGRKTFESIGKLLPNRENIILSSQPVLDFPKEAKVTDSIEPILQQSKDREIFIIGGEQVYKAFLPFADRLYITTVKGKFKADTYFPSYKHLLDNYTATDYQHLQRDENNPYDTRYVVFEKIK